MTIKRQPQDFRVHEILTDAALSAIQSEAGDFAIYRLRKESLSTPDALALVSKALRVPPKHIQYAGLKDKHAETVQHITVKSGDRELPSRHHDRQWSVERLGWVDQPLDSSHVAGNHFAIMVRNLMRRDVDGMKEAADLLTTPDSHPHSLRLVNYFGDQRFGSARHGQGFLAKDLMRGDFESALKLAIGTPSAKDRGKQLEFRREVGKQWGRWETLLKTLPRLPERAPVEHLARYPDDFKRSFASLPYFLQQISVEAYQSHLWNSIAVELVREFCADGAIVEADDAFGNLLFPEASRVPSELVDLNLPLLGRRTELVDLWKAAATRVLETEDIEPVDLHIPGLKKPFFGEAPRQLFIEAANFAIGNPQKDELDPKGQRFRCRIVMDLPRGSYATVALRALGQ